MYNKNLSFKLNLKLIYLKFLNIIIGNFRNLFHIRPNYYQTRLDICSQCQDKKNIFCGICGCIIKSKISVKNEKCPNSKW